MKPGRLLKRKPFLTGITLALAVAVSTVMPGLAVLIQQITNQLVEQGRLTGKQAANSLLFLAGICLLSVCYTVLKDYLITGLIAEEKERLFASFMAKRTDSFRKRNTAVYTSVLSQDIYVMENDYLENLFRVTGAVSTVVLSFLLLATISMPVVFCMMGFLVAGMVFPGITGKRLGRYKNDYLDSFHAFHGRMKDCFHGFEVIRSYRILPEVLRHFRKDNRELERKRLKSRLFDDLTGLIMNDAAYVLGMLLILICARLVSGGRLRIGDMAAVVQLTNSIMNPAMMIMVCIGQMLSAGEVWKQTEKLREPGQAVCSREDDRRMAGQMNLDPAVCPEDPGSGAETPKTAERPVALSMTGVNFRYPDAGKPAVRNVTFTILPGKKYLLTGRSGSGKSTILKLLLRYYSDYTGQICMGNRDYRELADEEVYDRVVCLEQRNIIFNDTLRYNLTLGMPRTEEEIANAVEKAALTGVVERLEHGLETVLEEDGRNLSGGERQRIEICRALLKQSEVFIVDEFTSGLDHPTAAALERELFQLDAAVIHVTHDLDRENLQHYDEIFVLDQGRLMERGTFAQLYQKKGWLYLLMNGEAEGG